MRDDTFLKEVGEKIRIARKEKKMPLTAMSALTKIDLSNLSILERGGRNFHILNLKSIADVLGKDVKDFL